ncbi:hypothetical protein [Shimazuella alba]|uniref:Uncharacterized protein n=1 Tax=Shimazuella alba TaxID=2690964 RepID=A0A6I4W115_9BACL|nr:hypothetical protein [Shimazuella alba]MXQ55875.1 hypothetical protein [Shimazuella alba]
MAKSDAFFNLIGDIQDAGVDFNTDNTAAGHLKAAIAYANNDNMKQAWDTLEKAFKAYGKNAIKMALDKVEKKRDKKDRKNNNAFDKARNFVS